MEVCSSICIVVSSDSRISGSEIFNGFLVTAQRKTRNTENQAVVLPVYLMNGRKIEVHTESVAHTQQILQVYI